MSLSSELDKQVQVGLNGKAGTIPVGYDRIGDYMDIARNTYYSLGGETGAFKSSFVHDMFIINPIQWYLKHGTEDVKLTVISFLQERKLYMYTSRWISRLIYQETGQEIPPKKILGRGKERMTQAEYDLVQQYYQVLDRWEEDDLLIAVEGSKNPSGISLYLEAFAKKHGTIHEKDKNDKSIDNILTTRTYEPNHPNHIVLVITDHIGILAHEKDSAQGKGLIDKFSRCMRECRDLYGFSPVIVQQLNRNMESTERKKQGELAPKIGDFLDSGNTSRDSDVIMALHDPYRHATGGKAGMENGYNLDRLKDDKFRTYYRSLHILKSSFEASGMQFPIAVQPVYGIARTLPRKDDITEEIYHEVISGEFFRPVEPEPVRHVFTGMSGPNSITVKATI
jgi:hypothetical protein